VSVFQRPFLDLLAELRRGRVNSELTEETHKLLAACTDTGKKGQITLTLTFEPDKDDDQRFRVTDAITVKTPKRNVKPSLFFLTGEGNLTRTDPNQETFDGLREVPTGHDTTEAKASRKAAN
jgi:hypothetical protein